ncbi:hypothetical protein BBJ28_00018278 [Nothophytophthora sp. Chile5]|nr:hypothetical protein BBJ28_00018278 [Nothophytophthora sp. Chile5]
MDSHHLRDMTQRDAELLLRPRIANSNAAQTSPLLPRHPAVSVPLQPAAQAAPRCWRPWLLRGLLLSGALYAALLLFWSASRLGLLSSYDDSTTSGSLRSTTADAFVRKTEELGDPFAPDDGDPSSDEVLSEQLLHEDDSETNSLAVETEDQPASLSQPSPEFHIKAMREAREKAWIQMNLPHMHHTLSPSGLAERKHEAEEHALSVQVLPADQTAKRRFRCVGWRATGDCSPDGPREPERDEACSRIIPTDEAGYCEMEDKDSGERFRVLRRHCNSLKVGALFRCSEASDFVNFPFQSKEAVELALVPGFTIPKGAEVNRPSQREGIVMVVYPRLLPSAYATIHALREVLDCQLPIELWFRTIEMQKFPASLRMLQQLADSDSAGGITLHAIDDPWASGFNAKIFAIYNSFFDRALFLDADNVPVRDPSFLFESSEFVETGALFWPDFWHPDHTIFNIHSQSLVWELLGMPFVDMFEQESGQILIDRRRHAAPLELVYFYAFHRPNHFYRLNLAYGDKDLFRFAWLKLNASFHMIQTPPAIAGKVLNASFCGMTMVQHDAQGEVLFLHRNSLKLMGEVKRGRVNVRQGAKQRATEKLLLEDPNGRSIPNGKEVDAELDTGTPAPTLWAPEPDGYPDAAIWTHLLSFRNASRRAQYLVNGFRAEPEFPKWQSCYGQRKIGSNPHFYGQEIARMSFAGLETQLRRFAMEAAQLHQSLVDALAAEPKA